MLESALLPRANPVWNTERVRATWIRQGPMGLRELTTYKWIVRGNGDLRT